MANKTENVNATGSLKGIRILKPGLLAAPAVVPISGAPVVGKFGKMEIPMTLDGQKFILPIALGNPQLDALKQAFGEIGPQWAGCTVRVSDGAILKQVNVAPVANATGKPVA